MLKSFITAFALLLALTVTAAFAQEKRWVASDGTTLKKESSISSADISSLPVGTELTLIESGGRWLKVTAPGHKEGWVYAGRVADAPPAAEVTGEAGLFGGTMQQSQIQTAKADSARSIRGLSPEATQYAKQRGTPEVFRKELDKVLARKVTAKELRAFLRDGKIGEYAP
ncbi:MAG: SH3 domain-containing protein [Geobacter sp.]|nr:MAG: SH3 domain-containing protein [Geobacter sp.]